MASLRKSGSCSGLFTRAIARGTVKSHLRDLAGRQVDAVVSGHRGTMSARPIPASAW